MSAPGQAPPGPGPDGPPAPQAATPHAPPPGDLPYHRLLRSHGYRWWKPLLGLLLFAVTFAVLGLGALAGGVAFGLATGADVETATSMLFGVTPVGMLVTNLSLAAAIPAAMLSLRLVHRLRPAWLSSVRPGLRWALLARLCLVATVLLLAVPAIAASLPGQEPPTGTGAGFVGFAAWAPFLAVGLLTTPLQAAGEEYAFRGYLLQVCGAWVRSPWFGVVVCAVLFAAAHGMQGPALFGTRLAVGLLAGWLVVRTGGLEAAIALHAVNNVVTLLLASAFGTLEHTITAVDLPWSYAFLDVAALGLFAAYADRLAGPSARRVWPR